MLDAPAGRAGYVLPTVRPVRERPGGSPDPVVDGGALRSRTRPSRPALQPWEPTGDVPAAFAEGSGAADPPGGRRDQGDPLAEAGSSGAGGAVLLGPAATARLGAALLAMLLRQRSARCGVLALWGQPSPAAGGGPPALPAARALAGRLADAGVAGVASGRVVRVVLAPDAEPALLDLALLDGLVDPGARVLVVPGARPGALTGVLADAALVVAALRPGTVEPELEALAHAELVAAAPRARVRVLALPRAVLGPSPRRLHALLEAG